MKISPGKEITSKLLEHSVRTVGKCTRYYEYTTMKDILIEDGGVLRESWQKQKAGEMLKIYAKAYDPGQAAVSAEDIEHSTNFPHLTGDALDYFRKSTEFVWNIWITYRSIRPHCIRRNRDGRFLISESVRGEGAILLNDEAKERFVR